ncbi:MAG: hypothetical protein WCC48_16770, partial [Anaeromyxobacteraceae bacterium]
MPILSIETPRWDAPGLQVDARLARIPSWAALLGFFASTWLVTGGWQQLVVSAGGPGVVWPVTGLFIVALLVTRARAWPIVLVVGVAASLGAG